MPRHRSSRRYGLSLLILSRIMKKGKMKKTTHVSHVCILAYKQLIQYNVIQYNHLCSSSWSQVFCKQQDILREVVCLCLNKKVRSALLIQVTWRHLWQPERHCLRKLCAILGLKSSVPWPTSIGTALFTEMSSLPIFCDLLMVRSRYVTSALPWTCLRMATCEIATRALLVIWPQKC